MRIIRNISFRDFEDGKVARLWRWFGAAAKIACRDPGAENRGDGVVGVELPAWAAIGIHVREDADGGGVSGIHKDDSVFVSGHGYGPDLVYSERYVQVLVCNRLVGLCVDDSNFQLVRLGVSECWSEREEE
jgi:hypothetical protein